MTRMGHALVLNRVKIAKRAFEPLTSDWEIGAEAKGFLNLFRGGKQSLAILEWDIRMTDEQRSELIAEFPENADEVAAIQLNRERTWQALLGLLTPEDRANDADRIIDARSEDAIARVPLEALLDR